MLWRRLSVTLFAPAFKTSQRTSQLLIATTRGMATSSSNTNNAIKPVSVTIVSDVVWPYCFIGLRHLEQASEASKVPIQLEWAPFLLNPQMSEEGQDLKEHLEQKYGKQAVANFGDLSSRLYQMGRAAGIEFNKDRRMVNTIKAHALVEAAKEEFGNEKANALMEYLFEKYFVEAKNISDMDMLVEAAEQVLGMDAKRAAMAMATGGNNVLAKDQQVKRSWGVSGVPFFVIESNNKNDTRPVAFSGAYPADVIAQQLQSAAGESS